MSSIIEEEKKKDCQAQNTEDDDIESEIRYQIEAALDCKK